MGELWAISYRQRALFYLHPDIHGIVSEAHAARIGAGIMGLDSSEDVVAVRVDLDERLAARATGAEPRRF